MIYRIPGRNPEDLEINTIILDLNGTLAVGGEIVDGVPEKLKRLQEMNFGLVLFTGNTRNDADEIAKSLGIEWKLAKTAEDKKTLAQTMEPNRCAAIGNGLIDAELMTVVGLGICVVQAEGAHAKTFDRSEIRIPTINNALDLFIDPSRLVATLRS